eukprot:CAMPEP_0172690824 /NCGR_PEP_ID=MMETSP1074-20121228/24134_1 /TAXON_ID=2916 /ORGANISM="Ceratium fusus, Strain PA161109" /LENGTH=259 /DNA_ID=CAMNT_0013510819 /DNA_START=23 /DNA_END=802 /DNA_ORIENTATION=-
MSHIPRRATHHGYHITGAETVPVSLKPGQLDLHRTGLYTLEGRGATETYLAQELSEQSEYGRKIATATCPQDYKVPSTAHRRPTSELSGGKKPGGTAHWNSEYNSSLHNTAAKGDPFFRQREPPYDRSLYPSNVVGRMDNESSHCLDYGSYGSNPRDRIRPGDSRLPVFGSMLIDGTIKGTGHIPGYQGHIPSHVTPRSARAGRGMATRSNDKTNITDIYHANLVGYNGHRPEHFSNDAGGRRPTSLTTHGSDFVQHLR